MGWNSSLPTVTHWGCIRIFNRVSLQLAQVKKAGEFYTPQHISDILSAIVTLDSQEPATGQRSTHRQRVWFCLWFRLIVPKYSQAHGAAMVLEKYTVKRKYHHLQPCIAWICSAWSERFEFDIFHGDTLNDWDIFTRDQSVQNVQIRRGCCQSAIQLSLGTFRIISGWCALKLRSGT